MKKIKFFLIILIFVGCGDIAQQNQEDKPSINKYILLKPINPPFIHFKDNNLGNIDEFDAVKFPSKPIPTVPNII